jgi:hypothetical protein
MTGYLFCEKCPNVANMFGRGWRSFLKDDEDEPTEVVILCPTCADREFGPPIRRTRSEEN